MNKTYQILKRMPGSCFSPSFVNEFDELTDARSFCNLCQKAEDSKEAKPELRWQFYVVECL
jgi:hypothetical protein